jgi:hypothetical protein
MAYTPLATNTCNDNMICSPNYEETCVPPDTVVNELLR